MQHARTAALGTLVVAIAASSVALADEQAPRHAQAAPAGNGAAVADNTGHHEPPPTPPPPAASQVNRDLAPLPNAQRAPGLPVDKQPVSGQHSIGSDIAHSVGRDRTAGSSSPIQLDRLGREQLVSLQTRLSELGFYRGNVDGILGSGTRSALQRFFQAQADLASRGVLTSATANMLGIDPSAQQHSPGSAQQHAPGGAQQHAPGSAQQHAPGAPPPAAMPHPQPSTL